MKGIMKEPQDTENRYDKNMVDVVSVRLVKEPSIFSRQPITSPDMAIQMIGEFLKEMDREVFCVMNLNSQSLPVNFHIVSIGTLNHTIGEPREVFKAACLSNAASMIAFHCHPSGNLSPSIEDVMMTDRLIQCGDLMGIPLLDHIIFAPGRLDYFSFKEKGQIMHSTQEYQKNIGNLEFRAAENIRNQDKWPKLLVNGERNRTSISKKLKSCQLER